jgi:hypothetical protein
MASKFFSWLPISKKICYALFRPMLMTCYAYSCTQQGLYFLKLLRFRTHPCRTVQLSTETYHKLTPQFVELQSSRWGGLLLLLPGTSSPTPLELLQLPCQFLHLRNCQRQLLLLFIEKRSDRVQIRCCRNTQKASMNSMSTKHDR